MAIFELILLKVSTLFFSKKSFDMQQTTNGVTRQLSNSTSSQTDGNQAQQNRNNATGTAGNWRCEVFVDTPITRELIQGPLNIHLPPIQLPAGLTNFMGQFAQNNSAQLQRQTSTTSSTNHDNGIIPATPNGQLPTINQGAIGEERSTHQNSGGQPQNPASPVSPTISWSRASSTPAVMNSSGSSTGESFVIDMDEDPMTPGSTNRIHRRRSSSPIRTGSGSIRHANPSSSAIVATNSSPSEPQLTQRTTSTASGNATLNQTFDGSTSTNGEGNGNAEEGGGTTDDDATMRNLRMRLHELIRRRHQIMRGIVEHSGEFPSLYLMGVLLSSLLVLFFVIIQFFAVEFTACLALIFAIFHYSDVVAFKRYISGTGSAWLIGGKIALRQFMILSVLGQSIYVLPPVIFRETAISTMQNPTFWSTLYIVFLTDFFIMDCMLGAKLFVANLPKCSLVYKRRLYQWLEYTAAIYRFAIPFVQWNAYLGALWWTVIYGGVKILLGLAMAWGWLLTTLRIFRSTHLGTSPTEAERKQHEQCTICFGEFVAPIKLKCSHIFCSECIRTWLDREHTCPICRAIVTKEDNNYRNGESMTPALF